MTRHPGRVLAALATFAILVAACGGGTATNQPAATAAGSPAAGSPAATKNPCFPVTGKCPEEATSLNGAGATFPAVIYTKWIAEYERLTGVKINYQSIGSGGGIRGITDKTVDFGGTDAFLRDDQMKEPILHVPTVLGGVVVTYNVPGVTTLKFTPEMIAGIFLGDIEMWNDQRIAAENPGVRLPAQRIGIVHRSDGSGTTAIFTDYLSKISPKWKDTVGQGTSVKWPTGIGARGNEGVANNVRQQPHSIGYVELIYAVQQKLPAPAIKNAKGRFVEATLDSVTKATQGVTLPRDLRVSITNSDNAEAYPISGFTWILAYENMTDRAKALALTRFLWWSVTDGQRFAKDLGYSPLSPDVQRRAQEMIRSIKVGGTPVLPQ